jgi:hypothetical protein
MPRVAALLLLAAGLAAADPDPAQKAGLQQVGDFVGTWKGSGDGKPAGSKVLWKQTAAWGWKFAGDQPALTLDVTGGKGLTGGVLTYRPKDKTYSLAAKDADGTERAYTGKLVRGKLTLESKDAATGDVRRLSFSTAAEGARLIQVAEVQAKGKGPFTKLYEVAATKEGESFAGGGAKNECVVTGGAGTMPVQYMGATYYVCCSGCRDEFNADPKKYVEAYLKSRKK